MKNKFILEDVENNKKTEFKTLREISKTLDIDYHQARELYAMSNKPKKYLHSFLKTFSEKYKIHDNPNLFKKINLQ